MFHIEQSEASISNLNTRIERHGEERQLAADIKVSLTTSSKILDDFAVDLRTALFRAPGKGEQQQLPIGEPQLTEVRLPGVEPLRLVHEFAGYELQIDGLLEGTEPILLADVKLKRFVVSPMEGGSVGLQFTASAAVEPEELRELSEALIRENVRLSLTPPARPEPQQMDPGGDGDTLDQQEAAEREQSDAAAELIAAGAKAAEPQLAAPTPQRRHRRQRNFD